MSATTDHPVSNLEYDLVTTLSNLMQGREVLDQYARDAEQAGDRDTAEIFRTIQRNNDDAATRLRGALKRQISNS